MATISFKAGSDFAFTATLKDGGTAVDISGFTSITAQSRSRETASAAIDWTVTQPGGTGVIRVAISAEDSATINYETGVLDIRFVDGDGDVVYSPTFDLEIARNVTRPA